MINTRIALNNLANWFNEKKRDLPWRNLPTPYRVWISEIMLQQTQVITVIPYFEKFVKKFPTLDALACAREEEVLFYWSGLGYYSRARNLLLGAKKIVEKSRFPKNREEWLEIPGVGPYTAGAILSIAQNQPEALLDGNVERVLSRVQKISRKKGDLFYKNRLWRLSGRLVQIAHQDRISPSVFNQALMELGATICTPRRPLCNSCPLKTRCKSALAQTQELFPEKKPKKMWIEIEEKVHCVINSSGQILLRKRRTNEWRAGLWDFVETLPHPSVLGRFEAVGECTTQHIVTRHKIKRQTRIWRLSESSLGSLRVSESGEEVSWENPTSPKIAVGSAFRKTVKQIESLFPHLFS